jgi:murein DD-endopeptidase MepM/ murein hydrolase activator NlpD
MPDTITTRPAPWAVLLAVVIGGLFYVAGQHVAATSRATATISVSADARVSALPDVAYASFGITVERQNSAKGAIEGVRKNMTTIIAAVKNAGVEDKDITTENFWLSPSYDYPDGRQTLRGYSAGQSLRVKVRNLENVGAVLTAATDAGANQAGDVTFSFDNTDELQAKARTMAIAEAKSGGKSTDAQYKSALVKISKNNTTDVNDGYYARPVQTNGGNIRKTQGYHGPYNGVDIGAPIGTPIYAMADGVVILARVSGYNGGYGGITIIQHDNGTQTVYAHQSAINVEAGQQVNKGQMIGKVGNTGRSSGPHLHFEIRGVKKTPVLY